jgi:DNA-binding LacI/PurR family transcriptional regulator
VLSHFAADANLLMNELSHRGYRRPGLVILGSGDRRTDFVYSATVLGYHERKLGGTPVPILRGETWDESEFSRWFESNRPDVVVLHQYPGYLAALEAWLTKRKLRVPRDLGLALLDKNPDPLRYAGVCQNPRLMGAASLEMLLGRLMLRDFGPPEHPKVELVEGGWNEGVTLRPVPASEVV